MTWKHIEQVAERFGYQRKPGIVRQVYVKTMAAEDLRDMDITDNDGVFANTPVDLELECVHGRMLLRRFITDTQDLETFDVNTRRGDAFLWATVGRDNTRRVPRRNTKKTPAIV